MSEQTKHTIEGHLQCAGEVDVAKIGLAVHAFVGGKPVAVAPVAASGAYKLSFASMEAQPAVELRLIPDRFCDDAALFPAVHTSMSPLRFSTLKGGANYAKVDISLPAQAVIDLQRHLKHYLLHGVVYTVRDIIIPPPFPGWPPRRALLKRPVPAAKLDFYEASWAGMPPYVPFKLYTRHLGVAYTAQDGSYEFGFDMTTSIITWMLTHDGLPDIQVRVSQFQDGAWREVYQSDIDWNIADDFQRDYLIPEADVSLPPADSARWTPGSARSHWAWSRSMPAVSSTAT